MSHDLMRTLKRSGFGDLELADILGVDEIAVREKRQELRLKTAFKRIDTCAAEFESFTPYPVQQLRGHVRGGPDRQAEGHHSRQRSEPHRPGHRVRLLLLPRGVRVQGRRLRDGDDQLQSRRRCRPTTTPPIACTSSR
jgi:carbamoyl-phosphate synthase large subunit